MMSPSRLLLIALLLGPAAPALAYVGPGAGISVLGSILGILATLLLALVAIVAWPVRKLLKRRKAAAAAEVPPSDNPGA